MWKSHTFWIAAGAAMLIVATVMPSSSIERLDLFLRPSAEKAYALGMRHFNSMDASTYSIRDASYFLRIAARLEPSYPYVHHQLARVYFLKALYPEALAEINIELANDPSRAPSYYMRGLIEGYLNDYEASVRDYKEYVSREPSRWEGRTDYAWALIKTGNFAEAADVIDTGLRADPSNPWLLSMRATIFYEQGAYTDALAAARIAKSAVEGITEEMWLKAYPGNAPEVASTGIQTLREAARANLEKIERAASAHTRSE